MKGYVRVFYDANKMIVLYMDENLPYSSGVFLRGGGLAPVPF